MSSIIKATDIAYVRFSAPDLDRMEAFLKDFGLHVAGRSEDTLYMRANGPAPFCHVTHKGEAGFVGLGFYAANEGDLKKLAEAEGLAVEASDAPGGGARVRLTDLDGFPIDVVAGQTPADPLPLPEPLSFNADDRYPRLGATKRIAAGPSHVMRLGHAVLDVTDFRASEAWYKARLGFVTSDEIELAPDAPLGAFLRCDGGERYVDHHTLFLVGTGKPGFNHAAWQVANFDDLMAGHSHLEQAGAAHVWGVGRHILGSQIFDYWRDPWGHKVEHWTDGDLFNNETPPGKAGIDALMGAQWGPDAPPAMAE
ncbi:VOC family protein [Parvibaculum sp.]|uniref:VOC family protein n=1 Tax=Parvibaculum sp. TaxID=2024848 RepID=UPI0025D87392|nr:VOC family protein [Parvibaculum sp.]